MCPVGRYIPFARTGSKPVRVWLLYLDLYLQARCRGGGAALGTTVLSNGKAHSVRPTEMTRPVKMDYLQRWSEIFFAQTGPKWFVPFDF